MSIELEQEYLQDAQNGDIEAYEELQVLLYPKILRFVRRIINDDDVVDDIVQDVFIRFYQSLNKIDPVENLRPYIFRIARNRCYDELRHYQRREFVSLDDEPVEARISFLESDAKDQPDEVTHWILLQLEVQEAMTRLKDKHREVLILYAEEELSLKEIAEVLDISVGTVKSRLYYAKKHLRGLLRPEILSALDSEFNGTSETNETHDNAPSLEAIP